jgi:hypothetical protein
VVLGVCIPTSAIKVELVMAIEPFFSRSHSHATRPLHNHCLGYVFHGSSFRPHPHSLPLQCFHTLIWHWRIPTRSCCRAATWGVHSGNWWRRAFRGSQGCQAKQLKPLKNSKVRFTSPYTPQSLWFLKEIVLEPCEMPQTPKIEWHHAWLWARVIQKMYCFSYHDWVLFVVIVHALLT